jgi:LysM repeat protein
VATSTPRISGTTEAQSYVVQPGDTLGEIAEQFGVGIEEIIRANDLEDADHIEVGQELIIP